MAGGGGLLRDLAAPVAALPACALVFVFVGVVGGVSVDGCGLRPAGRPKAPAPMPSPIAAVPTRALFVPNSSISGAGTSSRNLEGTLASGRSVP